VEKIVVEGVGDFCVPLLGEHNAMNAAMAIAVAKRMGVSDEQIAVGLGKIEAAEGRLQRLEVGGFDVLHDAYNANPSSMGVALKVFAELEPRRARRTRRVVVLGDMLELGVRSEEFHREVGRQVVKWGFDLMVAVGRQMVFAAEVAEAGGVRVVRFANTAAAKAGVRELLEDGDQILLKGSHGMRLEVLLESFTRETR